MMKVNKFRMSPSRGVSLIEFMIAIVIGSVISIAAFNMLVDFEENKRAVTTSGDADLVSMYVVDRLDRDIRSSGSAFTGGARLVSGDIAGSYRYFFGCRINLNVGGAQVLPAASALNAPFDGIPQNLRLAPSIIVDGGDDSGTPLNDVIITALGGGSHLESVQTLSVEPESGRINVVSGLNVRAGDLLLLAPSEVTGEEIPGADCMVTQVASDYVVAAGTNVNVGLQTDGIYYRDPVPFGIPALSVWANLGKSFRLSAYGVSAGGDLVTLNLARSTTATDTLAENIVSLQALYGIDDGSGLQWVTATGDYAAASLLSGTFDATERLKTIKAVRVAVVVQTDESAREAVSDDEFTVFSNTNLPLTVPLPDASFRYSTLESVIPIRNTIALPEDS